VISLFEQESAQLAITTCDVLFHTAIRLTSEPELKATAPKIKNTSLVEWKRKTASNVALSALLERGIPNGVWRKVAFDQNTAQQFSSIFSTLGFQDQSTMIYCWLKFGQIDTSFAACLFGAMLLDSTEKSCQDHFKHDQINELVHLTIKIQALSSPRRSLLHEILLRDMRWLLHTVLLLCDPEVISSAAVAKDESGDSAINLLIPLLKEAELPPDRLLLLRQILEKRTTSAIGAAWQ
jgi:hypothetical protein